MPHVPSGIAFKGNDDARDQAGICANGILPPALNRRGRNRRPRKADRSLVLKFKCVEGAAVEYLKPDQVKMDRVRIIRQVHQLPNLRGVQRRLLGHGHVPWSIVQQHPHRLLDRIP